MGESNLVVYVESFFYYNVCRFFSLDNFKINRRLVYSNLIVDDTHRSIFSIRSQQLHVGSTIRNVLSRVLSSVPNLCTIHRTECFLCHQFHYLRLSSIVMFQFVATRHDTLKLFFVVVEIARENCVKK